MIVNSVVRMIIGVGPALALALALAPPALADTCCANTKVELDPRVATPGVEVELTGLRCLAADNTGPLAFAPGAFWLWRDNRAAEAEPDLTPGEGLPQDLPPTEDWLPFDSVQEGVGGIGSAMITVPDVPDGHYQLWWWCEGGTPEGGIHYSTGPKLTVGDPPDTATADPDTVTNPGARGPALVLLLVVGATAFGAAIRVSMVRRPRDGGTGAHPA